MKLPNLSKGTTRYISIGSGSTPTEETGIVNSSFQLLDGLQLPNPSPVSVQGPCSPWDLCYGSFGFYCCFNTVFGSLPVPY